MPFEELCHLIEVSSHKRFRMEKAQELQELARNFFGFAMAGRETRIPKGLVPHRRSGIHRGFSYIAHNRRNVRFKGLRRVHTPPQPLTAHTAAHRANGAGN